MVSTTNVMTDRTIEVPLGTYILPHSARLVRTRADFYDTLKTAAEMALAAGKNLGLPTAHEEQQIYVQRSAGAKELRGVEELRDYFANNDEGWHAWGHTLAGLRFRETDLQKSYKIGDKITAEVIVTEIPEDILRQIADSKFTREDWKSIIGEINKVKGELPVPYSRGHVVREMHPTLGIFTEVEQTTNHKEPYALHGWLRENLDVPKDPISGHYDVAVGRRGYWHRGEYRCLSVDANYERWDAVSLLEDANSSNGFRPVVRGSFPEKKIEVASANLQL